MDRIIQIIPADGWEAVFDRGNGKVAIDHVVCFALKEDADNPDDVWRYVAPMVANGDGMFEDASDAKDFIEIRRVNPEERWHERYEVNDQ